MLSLSNPQNIFLNGLNTKYRAYVGGFGCVRSTTKVWTEFGLMRICDIDRPMRVLSWNEKSGQFQLSLSGGAFPKGRSNLLEVSTSIGVFAANEHHRSFSSDCKYQSLGSMVEGQELFSVSDDLLSTMKEFGLGWLPSDVAHLNQKAVDLMGSYADEARQYGQQFLMDQDNGKFSFPLQDGAHTSSQNFDLFSFEHEGDLGELLPAHIHPYRSVYPSCIDGSLFQFERLFSCVASQTLAWFFERTLHCRHKDQQSLLMKESRHIGQQFSVVDDSLLSSSLSEAAILSIDKCDVKEAYYDMQVMNTNNYVTEDGTIHHNSGKTFIGCLDLLVFFGRHPKTVQGYFGPTYPAIRDIFFPTFQEAAEMMGFRCEIRESNKEIHVYRGRAYYGTVICRSMDNPNSIVGFKISRALVDEIDVLDAKKAENAWNKIVARMRLVINGVQNSIGVSTTPEGFKFVYDKFANEPTESYSMVQASTYENADYLPPDYIDTLIETYPEQLITAYLRGEFINLTSGTVYRSYNRTTHRSHETVKPNEPVFVGMDFNIDNMAATVYVLRGHAYHAVDEISKGYNTPSVAEILKERYKDKGHKVIVYPDSSGKNRTRMGGVSESDISILNSAPYNFECRYNSTNPPVKDRINATNKAFESGQLFVNDKACPNVAACYEQQVYDDNGQPDKKGGKDHQNDASTYPIAFELPIHRPVAHIPISFNM